jgi:hypothetical protein
MFFWFVEAVVASGVFVSGILLGVATFYVLVENFAILLD